MQIIGADFVVLCDEKFSVIKKGGICFDTRGILEIGDYVELCAKYAESKNEYFASCAITPALANMHLHLEFSKNVGILHFGDFGDWLDSVLLEREHLMGEDLQTAMQDGILECLKSGVGFVGAISSYGADLEILANSPLRVMYFNEAIGSNIEALDVLYQNFLVRLNDSKAKKSTHFIPAIAVHSPYSVHPKLLEKVLEVAKKENLPVSAHFLESKAEREWLESSSGYFQGFYERFFKKTMCSFYSTESFLEAFSGLKNVYFTHCLEANDKILAKIKEQKARIITCPKSNRLLNNKFLDLSTLDGILLCLGTDGKSSNDSLSLLDELRIALFAYANRPLETLARELLLSVTRNVFLDSVLPLGELKVGNFSDFAVFKLPQSKEFLAQNLILYAKEAHKLYIAGEEVLGLALQKALEKRLESKAEKLENSKQRGEYGKISNF
ncbi:aminofutalosine deaminase family hydrolase [Helicobacter turcicus]|uniref:Metal-dependent hydrolase n=1 Tax=Helicobacter turcicus TaxID=2867412 RepID=A0ABS7JN23_9HELI|nr:aminofutalosine deaminase family hydrolase [Helicobacter turcicus]MBX7490791.1 metal-dependent hydrolase [Helicobacter turcicus]MBX7545600.1 metal-dependent hydrolase [Helicobacter turcicus]